MSLYRCLLLLILCNLVSLGRTAEATADMPTVMEAIVHAMIDFRKEILDNLQLSLEYHTEQLEEIKFHVEHKLAEQEKRMKTESHSKFTELRDAIDSRFENQLYSLSNQMEQCNAQSALHFKMLQESTNRLANESSTQMQNIGKTLEEIRSEILPNSCEEIKSNFTGTFKINPYGNILQPFLVLCNFEYNFNLGGGWTVFQRRIDGSVDFYHNWTMYKHGFGDVNGEHWLGLEKLHLMTKTGRHELLVLLEDFDGNSTYALYDEFIIGSEVEKYKLYVGKYSGTAGDSLASPNGMKFSTYDRDNDGYYYTNCAKYFKGAWWFTHCNHDYLNGPYYQKGNHNQYGVSWDEVRPYSLKSTTMMFRSRAFN